MRARLAAAAVLTCLASSSPSAADTGSGSAAPTDPDYFHVVVPWHVHVDGSNGSADISMGSAHIYLDPDWTKLDTEFRRLQSEDTRLTAENGSLKKTLEKWQPGWLVVATAVIAGGVIGWFGHEYVAPHL